MFCPVVGLLLSYVLARHSLLCFRGDSMLTATFCCPFSLAKDTTDFSQETKLIFVLLIRSGEDGFCCL